MGLRPPVYRAGARPPLVVVAVLGRCRCTLGQQGTRHVFWSSLFAVGCWLIRHLLGVLWKASGGEDSSLLSSLDWSLLFQVLAISGLTAALSGLGHVGWLERRSLGLFSGLPDFQA